jgi:hypothetical protein
MYEINPVTMSSQTSIATNMVSTSSPNVFTADGTEFPQDARATKFDNISCQLQHQRPSDNYAGSIELHLLRPIWPFHR